MKLSEYKIAALALIFKLILRNLFPKRINHSGINKQSRGFRLARLIWPSFSDRSCTGAEQHLQYSSESLSAGALDSWLTFVELWSSIPREPESWRGHGGKTVRERFCPFGWNHPVLPDSRQTGAYLAETLHFYRKESPEMGSCRKQSTQLQMGAEMTYWKDYETLWKIKGFSILRCSFFSISPS